MFNEDVNSQSGGIYSDIGFTKYDGYLNFSSNQSRDLSYVTTGNCDIIYYIYLYGMPASNYNIYIDGAKVAGATIGGGKVATKKYSGTIENVPEGSTVQLLIKTSRYDAAGYGSGATWHLVALNKA